jgi:peroxin-1
VLAATSRPDLIDPALLRPGRLDNLLYCSMPSIEDRTHILSILCTKSNMIIPAETIQTVAERCVGFSGADLQALVYSAQLEAVNETLAVDATIHQDPDTEGQVVVNTKHFEIALKTTHRSVSDSDLVRLETIYSEFVNTGAQRHKPEPAKRVTLA